MPTRSDWCFAHRRGPCRCGGRLCPPRTSRSTVRHCKGAGLVPRRGDIAGAQRLVLRTQSRSAESAHGISRGNSPIPMDPGFARTWLSALRPIWNGFCRKNRVGNRACAWQAARVNDYERIADVIRYLDEHHTTQPDLDTLAGLLGLSPFHFHRLFTSWAGVTPKDFLQCLTLERVKESLRRGDSVLDAAF